MPFFGHTIGFDPLSTAVMVQTGDIVIKRGTSLVGDPIAMATIFAGIMIWLASRFMSIILNGRATMAYPTRCLKTGLAVFAITIALVTFIIICGMTICGMTKP